MSTMLKTAAMTLLSKTLTTFLYKYLEDVDVEGVALPSVYDGSGWGVRLSNVKLREGVQLMERLPGSRRRRRKRKIPTHKAHDDAIATPSTPPSHSHTGTAPHNPLDASIHVGDLQVAQDESNNNSDHGEQNRPSTPDQDSRLFCSFRSSTHHKSTAIPPPASEMSDTSFSTLPSAVLLPPPPPTEDEADNQEQRILQVTRSQDLQEDQLPTIGSGLPTTTKTAAAATMEDDEVEWEDYEQPVKLILGDNGRIGTLDIRLIGKELHILVEDAVLTIEAIPIDEKEDAKTTSNATHETERELTSQASQGVDDAASTTTNTTRTAAGATTAAAASSAQKKDPKNKVEAKRDTVGDRVLADNPIARIIASIPHLFLRDIRIRFIVRDQEQAQSTHPTHDDTLDRAAAPRDEQSSAASAQKPPLKSSEASKNDSMLEIGIEFLAVTSGEDVLSRFQEQQDDDERPDGEEAPPKQLDLNVTAIVGSASSSDKNEYLVRRIRTGRGPEAGISVQVFAPGPELSQRFLENQRGTSDVLWARQQWIQATSFHLLRCSGVDISARIHLGTRTIVSAYSWFDYDDDDYVEYDESTLDSMLPGFDYVAPGPQLPLPPMPTAHMSRGNTPRKADASPKFDSPLGPDDSFEKVPALHPGVDVYFKDRNNIQSCKVPSSFHRISRGMLPGSCKDCDHVPSEVCTKCWEAPEGVKPQSELDRSLPMPGLVLQITFRDPLEVNIDRTFVETLGLLKHLFVKPPTSKENEETPEARTVAASVSRNETAQSVPPDSSSTAATSNATATTGSRFFSFFSRSTQQQSSAETEDVSDAFESFMQPENIQIMGLHLSEVQLRVHVLSENITDTGLSFRYWDLLCGCLTLDYQTLQSIDRTSQDLRLDVGYLIWNELKGTGSEQLATLGLPYPARQRSDSDNTLATMQSMVQDHRFGRTPWPSTASALLDIPPPLETMVYKDRERHGVQLRYISVKTSTGASAPFSRALANGRVGVAAIRAPFGVWRELDSTRRQISRGILGPNQETQQTDVESTTTPAIISKSLLSYSVQVDGGSAVLHPVVDLTLPLTKFCGERSSDSGMSVEALLNKIDLKYGKKDGPQAIGLTLPQIAALPETVRMRILLCLNDLKPLEEALHVKKETNPFRRTRAVNKGILKMAKKLSRKATGLKDANLTRSKDEGDVDHVVTRRQDIMEKLMAMDDKELNQLWTVHQKYQRKQSKKRNNVVSFTPGHL